MFDLLHAWWERIEPGAPSRRRTAKVWAWWLAVLVVVPACALGVLASRPRPAPMPTGVRWLVAGYAGVVAVVGVVTLMKWLRSGPDAPQVVRRGRDPTVCRACGYSVEGVAARTDSCPECGRQMDWAQLIELTRRRCEAERGSPPP